jgi:hypothetical protein
MVHQEARSWLSIPSASATAPPASRTNTLYTESRSSQEETAGGRETAAAEAELLAEITHLGGGSLT